MDQTSKLMDLIYSAIDFVFKGISKGANSSTTLIVLVIVVIILIVIKFILDITTDCDNYDLSDDDDELLPGYKLIRRKVKFSNKGYICYFDDCIRLLHNGVFITKDLVNIMDIRLSDNNHMIISHDGYEETVNGVKISYVTYRFICNEILGNVDV